MLRGGSWNNNPDNVRASTRNDNHPDNRNNNIGFRVLCSSHIGIFSARCPDCYGTVRNASRLRLAGRGRRWIDGAGESRPHAATSRRAHIKTECRLDSFPWRSPILAVALLDPTAQQFTNFRYLGADMDILPIIEPMPLMRESKIKAQAV